MPTRKVPFATGEFFHVYNRGVDKRNIFSNAYDTERFRQALAEFNTADPIGSMYENAFRQLGGRTPKLTSEEKLVSITAYCLNPNHYHVLLKQLLDGGISEFMKRLGGGYTGYFNNRHERSGTLFQGKFKAVHIESNEQLLHTSAYVNLNDRVHKLQLGGPTPKLIKSISSWAEYLGEEKNGLCDKEIILEQFGSNKEYLEYAEASLAATLARREDDSPNAQLYLEDVRSGE